MSEKRVGKSKAYKVDPGKKIKEKREYKGYKPKEKKEKDI